MTTLTLPREWCSTGTKTDPGAAAALTGFVSGNPVSSASHNFLLNELSVAARESQLVRLRNFALILRHVDSSVSATDTAASMAAVQRNAGTPLLVIKTAQAFGMGDSPGLGVQGVPASITSLVTDAASNGARVI